MIPVYNYHSRKPDIYKAVVGNSADSALTLTQLGIAGSGMNSQLIVVATIIAD